MDTKSGIQVPALDNALDFDRGQEYSFFQVVRLLELAFGDLGRVGTATTPSEEVIRFRSNATLGFPPADIEGIQWIEKEELKKILITVNFLGLYGPSSPIPTFYTEEILESDPDDNNARNFLDIFNHRLISLFYRCWEKYRYYICYRPGGNDTFSERIFALVGLSHPSFRTGGALKWERLLPYAGLLGMRPRSAAVLAGIISHYFGDIKVEIEEFVEQSVHIDASQWCKLGLKNSGLGDSAFLGSRVRDVAGSFVLHVGPMDYETYCGFLSTGPDYAALRELISLILVDRQSYSVKLHLASRDIPPLRLQARTAALGWNSWLGKPKTASICVEQAG